MQKLEKQPMELKYHKNKKNLENQNLKKINQNE
jgi:hypothetical protein